MLLLLSILLHFHNVNSPPYFYLADVEYQEYLIMQYFHKVIHANDFATFTKPIEFLDFTSFLPWNLDLKANAYLLDLFGVDSFWFPRVESIIAWHIAGLFLFLACLRFFSYRASLFSLFIFCFSPGAFLMASVYMPEPVMMMFLSASFFFLIAWFQNLSLRNYFTALALSFLAILFLPKCFFILMGIYIGFGLGFLGFNILLRDLKTYFFGLVCTIPLLMYIVNGWGETHVRNIFVFDLLMQSKFWLSWLNMLFTMMGSLSNTVFSRPWALINDYAWKIFVSVSLLSFFTISDKKLKMGIAGMLLGYLVFGISFTYHIFTHPYYHLQFFLIFLFLVAVGFDFISKHLNKFNALLFSTILFAFVSISWCFSAANFLQPQLVELKAAYVQGVKKAQKIAFRFKGFSIITAASPTLSYYGYKFGLNIIGWPGEGDYLGQRAVGSMKKINSYDDYVAVTFIQVQKAGGRYFIVNDFNHFEQETKLKEILKKYKIVESNPDFLAFDLNNKIDR